MDAFTSGDHEVLNGLRGHMAQAALDVLQDVSVSVTSACLIDQTESVTSA